MGGWWGVAGHLGLGLGRREGEGVVIHCKWHLRNWIVVVWDWKGGSVPGGVPLGVVPEGFMPVGKGVEETFGFLLWRILLGMGYQTRWNWGCDVVRQPLECGFPWA